MYPLRRDRKPLAEGGMGTVYSTWGRFKAHRLTKEIFTLIAGLVVAFIATNATWLRPDLNLPADLIAIFFLIILALVSFAEDKEADANRLSTWLKRRDGPLLYTRTVQGLMRALDRMLMPKTISDVQTPPKELLSRLERRLEWLTTPCAKDTADVNSLRSDPWAWPVYDAAIKLAFLYPIFFAMTQWTVTGASTGLGDLQLFLEEPRIWLRTLIFSSVTLYLVLTLMTSAGWKRTCEDASIIFAVCAIVAAGVFSGATTAGSIAAVALVCTTVGIARIAGTVAGAFGVTVAVFSIVSNAAPVLLGAFLLLIAFAVATIPGRFTKEGRGRTGYTIFTALLLAELLLSSALADPSIDPVMKSAWVFLGFFPLLNALFDWLSYGLTIWLIRAGNRRKGLWTLIYGLVDAVSAAMLFFALSLTLTCIIGWTNGATAVPILDITALFNGLSDPTTRGDYIWVAGMIFSTLVPTTVHLAIVALSVITWIPPRVRQWCEAGIGQRNHSGQAFTLSVLVVSALYAAYALVLTWGLFKLAGAVMVGISTAIPWYLQIVEACARAVGAM